MFAERFFVQFFLEQFVLFEMEFSIYLISLGNLLSSSYRVDKGDLDMPKIHITKRNIQALDRPQSGQVFYWDDQLAGFGIKATKTTMSFIVEGQVSRKRRRCVIGKTDVIPLWNAHGGRRSPY